MTNLESLIIIDIDVKCTLREYPRDPGGDSIESRVIHREVVFPIDFSSDRDMTFNFIFRAARLAVAIKYKTQKPSNTFSRLPAAIKERVPSRDYSTWDGRT